jgi:hypothetical protein
MIECADASMTVDLVNVRHIFPDGTVSHSDACTVNGSSIRYVHLPRTENGTISAHVASYIKKADLVFGSKAARIGDKKRKIDS